MASLSAKRILVLVGAGASVDFGIPPTAGFTKKLEAHLQADADCVRFGGWEAYQFVKAELVKYYRSKEEAHFERVYHALHELAELEGPGTGAVAEFKPVLGAFLRFDHGPTTRALRVAASSMLKAVYSIASTSSAVPKRSLAPLSDFVSKLESIGTTRIYTTNYDDFFSQAAPHLFTGFTEKRTEFSLFSPKDYLSHWDDPGLFHLHGSVHLAFPPITSRDADPGELVWFDSRDEAVKAAVNGGSGDSRLDGTQLERSPIVTGLDKLGRLQQLPYLFYYSGLAREAIEADLIIVLGSGLGDLHLNNYLRQARRGAAPTPLVYVTWWEDADVFYSDLNFDPTVQTVAMIHDLRVGERPDLKFEAYPGWAINKVAKAGICTNGFYSFLEAPDCLTWCCEISGSECGLASYSGNGRVPAPVALHSSMKGNGVRVLLSGRDHPYRQDFRASKNLIQNLAKPRSFSNGCNLEPKWVVSPSAFLRARRHR